MIRILRSVDIEVSPYVIPNWEETRLWAFPDPNLEHFGARINVEIVHNSANAKDVRWWRMNHQEDSLEAPSWGFEID